MNTLRNHPNIVRGVEALTIVTVVAIGSAACGGASRPAPNRHPTTAAASPSRGGTRKPHLMWPGTPEGQVPYPGRVALPDSTCMRWGVNNPQPVIIRNDKIYTIVDARRSYPPQCDYQLDEGAGTYRGASYDSRARGRPDGSTHIPDGTVVEVVVFSLGESACNRGGTSSLWEGVKETPAAGPPEWVPAINLGGGPSLSQLKAHHIPEIPSQYAGTVTPSC